jgi:hypothetical protein
MGMKRTPEAADKNEMIKCLSKRMIRDGTYPSDLSVSRLSRFALEIHLSGKASVAMTSGGSPASTLPSLR